MPRKAEAISTKTPVDEESLASAIRRIAQSMDVLRRSGLNHEGVVALIADHTKLGKNIIRTVLESLGSLEEKYCG